ncbi:DUF4124 domain-containing protein [Permianibacter sp. IMCC34836]|uniref:DUF4124 domain-containing protein n=1 Tax=Permianibacter fluminis TaxID=2738515 RepID=UPI00155344FE|nr:DUF4124 domain-containing protein [Permianibacter fluminis]NQD38930.1 DUF4124 domain-containing protein [Permianibacter fluminis]
MKSLRIAATIAAALMVTVVAHAADSYKWTDDNGQVQYTQIPPKDRPYETIRTRVKEPTATTTTSSKPAAAKESEAAAKGDVAVAKAEADKLARNCEVAKQNKEMLQTAAKIKITDKDGTERHLTDEERKEKLAATELQMQNFCKK